jgi:uncharacterized protein YndB with AHSA1/START domain
MGSARRIDMVAEVGPGALSPESEIVSSCLLDASPEQVFEAWRDPGRLAKWWGPAGFRNTFEAFDFRPGGAWRFVMHGPDGKDYPNVSRFVEVVPGERIVLDHENAPRFRLTATLLRRGRQTEMVWYMRFESAEVLAPLRGLIGRSNEENFDRLGMELYEHYKGVRPE